ncbi:hypothetical protein TSMEX_008929 [Taenia solium]|eukprot:TsM_000981500 transcript=TsM_000981500 gene=TsM_000981500
MSEHKCSSRARVRLTLKSMPSTSDTISIFFLHSSLKTPSRSAPPGVATNRLHFNLSIPNGQDGHVESATTLIKDEHIALLVEPLAHTVDHGSCRQLIDEVQHVCTGQFPCFDCGSTLVAIKSPGAWSADLDIYMQ